MGLIETLRTATAGGTTSGGRCEIHGRVDAPFEPRGGSTALMAGLVLAVDVGGNNVTECSHCTIAG